MLSDVEISNNLMFTRLTPAATLARVFTLPVEQLGYVMRCFASISA